VAATHWVLLGGGIGSGKSSALEMLSALGADVLSADDEARAVVEPGEAAYAEVVERWPEVVRGDGRIDRAALAGIVFADPEALHELEAITHPAVAARIARRVARSEAEVLVVEVPLLVDLLGPGWIRLVVDAPDEVRVSRLEERGMDPEDAARRMAAQPSRETWLAAADLVVDNGGDRAQLERECRRVWAALLER
jgi:dephospho-CoA kinase